jgi:hypothetical protein
MAATDSAKAQNRHQYNAESNKTGPRKADLIFSLIVARPIDNHRSHAMMGIFLSADYADYADLSSILPQRGKIDDVFLIRQEGLGSVA